MPIDHVFVLSFLYFSKRFVFHQRMVGVGVSLRWYSELVCGDVCGCVLGVSKEVCSARVQIN